MRNESKRTVTIRDSLITLGILAAASLICILLQRISPTDTHVPLLFVLAVVVVSRYTNGYIYGITASLLAVMGVNYAFTYPYFKLNFTLTGYPLTFIAMLSVSLTICTMTSRIKEQERVRLEMETEKMRSNLLRSVSHDLRTPLTSIMGSASAILDEESELDTEQKKTLLHDIRNEAECLTHAVENILFITKLNSNGSRIQKVPELAEEIASSAVNKFRRRYPEMAVEVRVPVDALLIPMDAVLIEQVLLNMMENAVQHGKTTSQIWISIEKKNGFGVFTVEDDGCGISGDVMPHLFDGMLPVGERESGQGHNMRIGLSICRSIIDAHEGSVRAENRPEGGARFIFELPLGDTLQ